MSLWLLAGSKFVSYITFYFPLVTTKPVDKDCINIKLPFQTFILHFI